MKIGHFSDDHIPECSPCQDSSVDYKLNSRGYRCAEWDPLPTGKKNMVVMGCSHTFGVGNEDGTSWVDIIQARLNRDNKDRLIRVWNLGCPGASADKVTRLLMSTEKVLFPKIILICWPEISRRERLQDIPSDTGSSTPEFIRHETEQTDLHNLYKNIFLSEKYAEKVGSNIFHCFANDTPAVDLKNVYNKFSLRSCWPVWDNHRLSTAQREHVREHDVALDGKHFGSRHHSRFGDLIYDAFGVKIK